MEPPPFFSSEDTLAANNNNGARANSLPPPNVDSDSDNNLTSYTPQADDTLDNTDINYIANQIQSAETKQDLPPPFFSNDSQNNEADESLTDPYNAHSPPTLQQSGKSQPLDASTTRATPEPEPFADASSSGPPPPPYSIPPHKALNKESKSIPIHAPPQAPYESSDKQEPPLARNRQHSYNVPPPGGTKSSRARTRNKHSPAPPRPKHTQIASEGNITLGMSAFDAAAAEKEAKQEFAIDQVSFTSILRQVDVGVEMTDRLKEVIRKFCKHQQMGADKLQEIYNKLPSTYVESDGMKGFADLCALVHQLILETVSAQKRLADFLFKDVVPKMDGYIKEKQQQVQQLKRDNQQAEMKLKNAINSMSKASNAAKSSASKAKQMARDAHSKGRKASYNHDTSKKKKGKIGGLFNKFGSNQAHLPEDEQAYLKAQTNQLNYEATVMAANYEQGTYNKIQSRFKRDCKGLEQQRLSYCQQKIQQVVNAHRSYFNNETIMVLQTRILSGLDTLDSRREFQDFLHHTIATNSSKGQKAKAKREFIATKYDYQNVFHSLQDSMDITHKLAPHAKLPLVLTSCCNKVRDLNGFQTEGIFRKSAMATEIDRLKQNLSRNQYQLDTKDPHVAACLLKDWLRGLKDSLIPQTHYDMALQMAKKQEVKAESLEVFLSQLPEVNRETLKYLVRFLKDLIIDENKEKTRMGIENVAIVFAPTILKCPHTDAKVLLANSRHEKEFTIDLINQLDTEIKQ